jgi:cyclase
MTCTRRDLLELTALTIATTAVNPIRALAGQTAPPAAPPQAPAAPPQTSFTALRRNVGMFTGRGGTIGWMVSKGGLVIVDTQFPETAQVCLDGIKSRAGGRTIDLVMNTHHHGDHTSGNGVFKPAAAKIVAHERVPELQKAAAARQPNPQPQTVADTTFPETFRQELGDEIVHARYLGPAHTGGDSAIFFEKANIVHMGDLMFNRRHPFIDRPGGASIAGWITVLERIANAHGSDTLYIFGHAGEGWKVTGSKADLMVQRDYFTALLDHVRTEIKAGKPAEAITKSTAVLKGFEDHGPLIERVLTAAFEEVSAGGPSGG